MRRIKLPKIFVLASLVACLCLLLQATPVNAAITQIPIPEDKSGSYGLEATKTQPPPTQGATISVPGNGASYGTSPIQVSGTCPNDLLVQVYVNGVMAGSVICKGGSFTLQIGLFAGANDITASVFDNLDQTGPASNSVTVTYNAPTAGGFGSLMTLSSAYGRRAANPNAELVWPLVLSGGSGPYAFSIDWGDGTPAQLKSQGSPGEVKLSHVYKKAGVYTVVVKVTDVNGATAFIQLTAVANGKIAATSEVVGATKTVVVNKIMWIPLLVAFVLLFPTFWLGRRSQLVSLHKQLQKTAESFKEL